MSRLKPWYQVVTPREDLRENRPLMRPNSRSTWTMCAMAERMPTT